MNEALGNVGRTVVYTERSKPRRSISSQSLRELVARHERRQGGPARDPRRQSGLHRARRSQVRRRAGQGASCASTSACTTTKRRSCATGRSPRRTSSRRGATRAPTTARVSIVQPLIAPLYGGQSAHEVLAAHERPSRALRPRHRPRALDDIRNRAALQPRTQPTGLRRRSDAVRAAWRRWLHDGVDAEYRRSRRRPVTRRRCRPSARHRRSRSGRGPASRSRSASIPRCSTAGSPTTAGCRNCRSRSRS